MTRDLVGQSGLKKNRLLIFRIAYVSVSELTMREHVRNSKY